MEGDGKHILLLKTSDVVLKEIAEGFPRHLLRHCPPRQFRSLEVFSPPLNKYETAESYINLFFVLFYQHINKIMKNKGNGLFFLLNFFEQASFDRPLVHIPVVVADVDFFADSVFLFNGPDGEAFSNYVFRKSR